ncbi:MAG: hypothetical protein UU05_C0024G0028 [Candidatus Curtissbacteria bacterium GW2011_GWA1_40_47]|uniref:Uncharacterized protein n=1 Tax=Candidatus Curtissbacteria bacterium RIFOXYA1_FULL_41_14 TaxID=1797737 RepID=A0A1F5HBV6_9BACT|nr:MAG: hypothetical protein UT95_C0015G0004 [Candidatus Curtissbacteria bacterium GW2011_GWB1_40_28]KKR60895.1 MAG: hypothetical protein UT99_C0005G0010 [Candidatus Curtissbacteria bacterium GW2011_GWA2_40_31]KKR61472.1 MAG: hypothetical protein UU00_C0013G0048 [Microgenomates group bacterium GW2011_GWC1_40_35]KKR65261.1 MAG: hypothetical protein UU05_C0024G0028 [Candidatus Curtissbacteria bacterium GW2011_GWA1_40_47]KKR77594.1 MAG: hypothetical protein UU19_C0007G0003 [Candidatus Curtissbacte
MDQKKVVNFLSFWVANTVVLLLGSVVLKSNVVLGNDKLSAPLAAIISGLILTGLIYLVPEVVKRSGYKIKDQNIWVAAYFIANVAIIWIIKRLAIITAFGISSIFWVLVVALVVTLVELGVAKITGAMKLAKK